jgi:hypothetical protein
MRWSRLYSPEGVVRSLQLRREWILKQWYPVADDFCGNYWLIVPGGAAIFVNHERDYLTPDYVAASSLAKLIEFLAEDAHSAMRQSSRLASDPDIVRFGDLGPMPWT